jgi:hypothetical protein
MRIDRLDLIAFGPFTELSLDLSAPGIHMIVGPNEAGKSTALHALGQLLYGMDLRSAYGFVHPTSALRLGGLLYLWGADTRLRLLTSAFFRHLRCGAVLVDQAVKDLHAPEPSPVNIDRSFR